MAEVESTPGEGTTPVYDISGEQPVLGDIPHSQIQDAISSGKYSFPKGQEVSVVDPSGKFGTIPADQAPAAFTQGYQYATPSMLSAQQDQEKYGAPEQQVLAGVEGAAKGIAGPLAPLAERGLGAMGVPGLQPEDIRKRAEINPWTHGLAEAGGFGVGLFTGASEASLIGKAADLASGINELGEGASIAARLGAGASKIATEMALFQAGDEASKAILQDPHQTVGSAAANIGLSGLLGGVAGIPLTGIGIAGKAAINSQVLKDFADRLGFRGSNVDVNEKIMQEFGDAQKAYHEMGSEVGGSDGIRAQAMKELLPEVNEHIVNQAQEMADKINGMAEKLAKEGDRSGMVDQLQKQASRIEQSINPSVDPLTLQPQTALDSANIYDTLNQVKRQMGEWGQFNKAFVPLNEVSFRNAAKGLGHSIKEALEDGGIWSKAGDLQKELNSAWAEAIPSIKDAESKFMTKIGGQPEVDPAKFLTYMRQNGKSTSQTIRQQMMGKFVDAVEKFQAATSKAYEAAGAENPFQPISAVALRESLEKPSIGSKLADLWYDHLGAKGAGDVLGGSVGGALGHATGIPEAGFGGAYLGKWALGPAFTSIIKPLMEKGASLPAFQDSIKYLQVALKGEHALSNAATNVFKGMAETIPSHLFPDRDKLEKLDHKIKNTASNQAPLLNVAGRTGDYLPDHAGAISQTAMNAVNVINSQRPSNPKQNPLDTEIPISKAQKAEYFRSLAIAQQPLVAIQHIKDGTLTPKDVATIKTIYPNFYNQMSKKLMSAMTDHISEGGSVPYKTRQSLSLFLGQPLDSTMTPASVQSIQAMYAQKQPTAQPQEPQGKIKKGASKLGKLATSLQTSDQARASRVAQG